jgi:hypothetical protein
VEDDLPEGCGGRGRRPVAAHGAFLTQDRLAVQPWLGRSSHAVAGLRRDTENTTARIPKQFIAPLIQAKGSACSRPDRNSTISSRTDSTAASRAATLISSRRIMAALAVV